jgi:hypothetical protein
MEDSFAHFRTRDIFKGFACACFLNPGWSMEILYMQPYQHAVAAHVQETCFAYIICALKCSVFISIKYLHYKLTVKVTGFLDTSSDAGGQ